MKLIDFFSLIVQLGEGSEGESSSCLAEEGNREGCV